MNKNILIGLLVVAVLVVGGILITNMNNPDSNPPVATSTPSGATSTEPIPPPVQVRQAGAPLVATQSNATPSNSTVVLSGTVTPNGAQTSYWFEYGRLNVSEARTVSQAVGSGFIQINAPAYVTGLSANTTYSFRLVAQNAFGIVSGATYSFATNSNPPPQGTIPTTRTSAATDIARTGANLNGSVDPNGAQTSYWFEYGESADLGDASSFQSAGTGTASVNALATITNLKPLTKYFFRLNAQNQFGTVNGSIMNFTTAGPAAPGAPVATTNAASAIASTSVSLNGRVNPNGDITTYWFEYSKDSLLGSILGSTTRTQATGSGTVSVAVSGTASDLQSNTKYFYRLAASNSYGTTYGSIATFQTKR